MFGKKFLFLKIYELKSTRKIKNVDVNRKIGKLKLFIGNLKTNTVHKSGDSNSYNLFLIYTLGLDILFLIYTRLDILFLIYALGLVILFYIDTLGLDILYLIYTLGLDILFLMYTLGS